LPVRKEIWGKTPKSSAKNAPLPDWNMPGRFCVKNATIGKETLSHFPDQNLRSYIGSGTTIIDWVSLMIQT
jgi:hypothetical protein